MTKKFPLVSKEDFKQLQESLLYLKVAELKKIADRFGLPETGKKPDLLDRILTYIQSGKIKTLPEIPAVSRAQKGEVYPLAPETLMLHGSYKCDMRTRIFFKELIGGHFHFTAFGLDWLKQRWLESDPPTYGEFAQFWQDETDRRKKKKVAPKQEWKLINFALAYAKEHPKASRMEILGQWAVEREWQVGIVEQLLGKIVRA